MNGTELLTELWARLMNRRYRETSYDGSESRLVVTWTAVEEEISRIVTSEIKKRLEYERKMWDNLKHVMDGVMKGNKG